MHRNGCLQKVYAVLFMVVLCALTACGEEKVGADNHIHSFSMWEITTESSCITQGMQTRKCGTSGYFSSRSYRYVPSGRSSIWSMSVPGPQSDLASSSCAYVFIASFIAHLLANAFRPTKNPTPIRGCIFASSHDVGCLQALQQRNYFNTKYILLQV